MKHPPGYNCPLKKVCPLCCALYGLKHTPQSWYAKLVQNWAKFGFTTIPHDTSLFKRKTTKGIVIFILYLDDMIITAEDNAGISEVKEFFITNFEMKDLGSLNYFLGVEVLKSDNDICLYQVKYSTYLLSKTGISDNKIESTPLEPNVQFSPSDGTLLSNALFIGHL